MTSRRVITTISIPFDCSRCASHQSSPPHCGLEPPLRLSFQSSELRSKSTQQHWGSKPRAPHPNDGSHSQILASSQGREAGGLGRCRQSSSTLLPDLGVWGGRVLALGPWERLPEGRLEQKSWLPPPVTCSTYSLFPTRTALMGGEVGEQHGGAQRAEKMGSGAEGGELEDHGGGQE